jgi:hypothetical protein
MTSTTSYTDYRTGKRSARLLHRRPARDVPHGLVSENSNEVSALPAYVIDWANLQWPFTINHTISTTRRANIYAQVYIAGVITNLEPHRAAPQVGYGAQ